MKRLVIVYHSKTGNTAQLIHAAREGTADPELEPIDIVMKSASDAGPKDLLGADGLLLGTPENFGYMSGALKDFFDRTFYEVEGQIAPLPYALVISAGNDGSGAVRAIERIANGYPLVRVQEPLIIQGPVTPEALHKARELGMTLAAGLALGMY